MRTWLAASVLALPTLCFAGSTGAQQLDSGRLTVFAAASLTGALPKVDPRARYGFAGSDILAAQIQQGSPADVFAAASPKYPEQLYKLGLVQKPIAFPPLASQMVRAFTMV